MSAITFIILSMQATLILSALPPIQKCSLSDPACLQKSAQNAVSVFAEGIPEIGVETLEPVHIDVISIDLSGLKLTVKDADVKGLGNSTIDKVKFDTSKKVLEFVFHAPIVLKGKYKASGRLLILRISGDGDVTIKIKSIVISLTMVYDIVKNENGKDVIELKSYKYSHENKVNTHFKLTNLFNGNKQLNADAAAAPARFVVAGRCDGARVSTHVASHTKGLPIFAIVALQANRFKHSGNPSGNKSPTDYVIKGKWNDKKHIGAEVQHIKPVLQGNRLQLLRYHHKSQEKPILEIAF